ncbi:uncharacterized membrane protein HdeD (DUF308 family) [Mucilaginibacter frigoritolerans]|uniref:Uncharacterized membrane protein HdeD (DUF308 family) n=1 Tax=Mucilaginibacter frigoritolerans TaxID=652788 RepID=A0A562TYB1_9SPHI|nr:DUF308 domain-containing protein [Mucilaginibacter frigoritolerans]TWI98084.1 uncharacterized membrane protein HdeD (DUF308 family) [Mucilaginibacter frigoritolerans]
MDLGIDRSIRHWWVFLIRGILFVLVGIYMIASPVASFITLGFLFGLIIFVAGVSELFHVVQDRTQTGRSWHLMLGIIDLILGAVLMSHVTASMAILRIVLGLWFLFRGVSLFMFLRRTGSSWLLIAGAALTFIFGLLILFNPTFGDLTIIIWTAIAFIVTGFFNIAIGLMMRRG